MFKYGKAVCTECMDEVDCAYYIPAHNLVLKVKRNGLKHYIAVVVDGDSKDTIGEITQVKTLNGIFKSGKVNIELKDKRIISEKITPENRICFQCYQKRQMIYYLPHNSGYYRTYVIALVGRPSVGKTSLKKAILKVISEDDSIVSNEKVEDVEDIAATQLSEKDGLIAQLVLNGKGRRKINVLLVDTPGELLLRKKEKNNKDIGAHNNRISRIDGMIYVLEKGSISAEDGELLSAYTEDDETFPMAIVMSKSDELKLECDEQGCIRDKDKMVLTPHYFDIQKKIERKDVYEQAAHMLIDKRIINLTTPVARGNINKGRRNIGYFVVSAGESKETKSKIDLTKSVNISGPLKFILGALGVYRYKEVELHE